ncbi:MAG: type III secretion system effector protein [Bacteroidales bacterium]|nr:type III secretion system effector protein [Bacteroidales bacterium]MCM1148055.1 type III secretion system effector protein [Bacteroidales bacterium]MCM1207248.1 type III secretion system effector protein [Bacillota bacterium]MCM1509491.1 type III secretion system effector protein [Clostridium sp.]
MKLSTGTSLISELVNHDRTVEIMQGNRYHTHDVYIRDAFNGKGTDTEVYYNFDTDVTAVVQNRETGKSVSEVIPRHIALGHELIHGHRSLNGVGKDTDLKMKYSYTDTDSYVYEAKEKIEELETTGLSGNYKFTENGLREEEKLRKRIKY